MPDKKPKLLVVDDEADQCEPFKNYFSRRGFFVFTASTGEEALALIKKNKPDLVFLDMKLESNMDGKDVLRILRQNDKETKVALVTGDILNEQAIQEITDLGIVEFLAKPVNFKTLENIIKKVLENKYPEVVRFEEIKPKEAEDSVQVSLRHISHDLSNITSDIANKCELYILDTEEGLYKDKSEKERLAETINILKSVLKLSERLKELVNKISSLAKKEI